jgi:beta-glucosidase
MNCNCYRFSLEWSRIEPEPGKFSPEATKHYHDVIDDLLEHDIEPVVTIHHYTNPIWFEDNVGWHNPDSIKHFKRYVDYVATEYGSKVKFWITINEPNIYTLGKYLAGAWHPYKRSVFASIRVFDHLIKAHKIAYLALKKVNNQSMVSIALQYIIVQPVRDKYWFINKLVTAIARRLSNTYFYDNLHKGYLDYIAFNFYTRSEIALDFSYPGGLRPIPDTSGKEKMTFIQYVEDILVPLSELKKYNLPLLISENGVVTDDDSERARYLQGVIAQLKIAKLGGANLIGYIHWSLIDNFEWHYGYDPKFGLFDFDRQTFERVPKPSTKVYAQLIKDWNLELGKDLT